MYVFNKGQFSNNFLNSMTKFMYIYCKKCPNLRVKWGACKSQNGPNRTKTGRIGLKRAKSDQNGPNWTKTGQIGPKWAKMDQVRPT